MPERRAAELIDNPFLPELVAAADRAALLEADRGNIAVAVTRLAHATGRSERYNEGINCLATVLAWIAALRPSDYAAIHHDGLLELRRMLRGDSGGDDEPEAVASGDTRA